MKSASAGFIEHLSQDTTSLCHLWKVTRRDGRVYGFTDHPKNLVYPDLTYLSSTGFDRSSIESSSDLSVDNLEITSFQSDVFLMDEIEGGLWDRAEVLLMLGIHTDPDLGTMILRRGRTGEIRTGRVSLVAELRGMMQALQFETGRLYTVDCDADLGDTRCKIDLEPWKVDGEVTDSIDRRRFTDSMIIREDGWFQGSRMDWDSGENSGLSMEVKSYMAGEFELQQPMPNRVSPGDAFSACRGCDKSRQSCLSFGNYDNYRGFPDLPGLDRLLGGK